MLFPILAVHKLFLWSILFQQYMFLNCGNITEGLGSVSFQGIWILQATERVNPPPTKLKANKKQTH